MVFAFVRRAAQCSGRIAIPREVSFPTPTKVSSSSRQQAPSVAALFSVHTRQVNTSSTARASCIAQQQAVHANDVTGVLAGVAVVSAVIGVAKMWWDASLTAPANRYPVRPRGPAGMQNITRDEMKSFFEDLKASIQELFNQMPEIDAAFRKHVESQGVKYTEAEYKQSLLQQLFDVLQNIEQQVVGGRGWDQESFAMAMEKYAEDEEIVRLQEELQVLMQSVFPPQELPEHVTPEKTIEILAELMKGMEKAMEDMLKHARSEGITDPNKAMEEFQQIYLEQVQQITHQQMKLHDIPDEIFNFALQKFHAENTEFRSKVEQLYAQQAAAFRRMGLKVDGEN